MDRTEARELAARIQAHLNAQQWQPALDGLDRYCDAFPNDRKCWYLRAFAEWELGHAGAARTFVDHALAVSPDYDRAQELSDRLRADEDSFLNDTVDLNATTPVPPTALEFGDSAAVLERFGLPADKTLVTFVGNLLKHKGLHRIVHALARIADHPWHLVVAGVGPEHDDCVRRLEQEGLRDRATFLGRLSGGDVERVLAVSGVLTLPSTQEGMPYVILEAMASGVPVVSTAVYGIPEMVVHGETGLLVEPGDRDGLRNALAGLIDSPEERARLGRAARRRFEDLFTLERQLRRIEALYLDVARPARHRRGGRRR